EVDVDVELVVVGRKARRWPWTLSFGSDAPPPFSACHTTTKLPAPSVANAGADWYAVVYVFTWNCGPCGLPALSKPRARTLNASGPFPALTYVCHTPR